MRQRLLVLALAILAGVGCSTRALPQLPDAVPAAVETADSNLRAATVAGLELLDSIGDVVNDMSRIRANLEADGVGTPEMHSAISSRLVSISQYGLVGIDRLREGVATWAELKAVIDPMLQQVNPLVDAIEHAAGTVKSRLQAFGLQVYALVLQLVGVGSGDPVLEGA